MQNIFLIRIFLSFLVVYTSAKSGNFKSLSPLYFVAFFNAMDHWEVLNIYSIYIFVNKNLQVLIIFQSLEILNYPLGAPFKILIAVWACEISARYPTTL